MKKDALQNFCLMMLSAPESQCDPSVLRKFAKISLISDWDTKILRLHDLRNQIVFESSASDFIVSAISIAMTYKKDEEM